MAKDLGRSARHFLPPFWEEVGRTFKDLGNQTYAGRALTKSLDKQVVRGKLLHERAAEAAPPRACRPAPARNHETNRRDCSRL